MDKFDPDAIANEQLEKYGLTLSTLINSRGNSRLFAMAKLRLMTNGAQLVKTYRKAIKRHKAFKDPQQSIDKYVKNALVQDIKADSIKSISDDLARRIQIEWLPSTAKVPDLGHAEHYYQKMSLYRAKRLGMANANGKHFGCKCKFRVIGSTNAKKLKKGLTK